jgi:4-hydroxybenzoate polyprenyltransferase
VKTELTATPAAGAWPDAGARPAWWRGLWTEIRPQQWVKNLLVLAPLLFAHQLFAGVASRGRSPPSGSSAW